MIMTERRLRKVIRQALLSEAALASASDINRFKPQMKEWLEVLIDEMAETIPKMKEITEKKREHFVTALLKTISVELVGLTSSMSHSDQRKLDKRSKEKAHQEWDKKRKARSGATRYYGEYRA